MWVDDRKIAAIGVKLSHGVRYVGRGTNSVLGRGARSHGVRYVAISELS